MKTRLRLLSSIFMLAVCMNAIAVPPPIVTWNTALLVQPITSTTFLLTGGLPEGGTYSGPGVTGTNFNASIVGPGTHTLYYTFTDSTGASATASNTITVFAMPMVVFSGTLSDQCVSSTTYTLTGGSPAGGTYSGPGVANGNFNASVAGVGTHTLVYSITNSYGYVSSSSNSIIVHELPVANAGTSFPIIPGVFVTLSGSASAGTGSYSFAWTPADSLLPGNSSLAQPTTVNLFSTNTFTLIVTDLITGCQSIPDSVLVVCACGGPLVANATADDTEICVGTQVTLGVTTTGGSGIYTYSWTSTPPGFSSTSPSPGVSPSVTTTYTVAANDGFLTTTSSVTVIVHPLPPVIFPTVLAPQCVSSTVYYLSGGSPPGGTYSGPGLTGTNFNASVAGVGTHTITYSFRNSNGCLKAATNFLIVYSLPIVAFNGVLVNQCVSSTTYILSGGSPPGGTYSGPGVTGTNFNASIAGVGTHTLTYTYMSAMTVCMSAATKTITVYPLPVVTMPTFPDVCISTPGFYLSGGLPYNGTYSINGVYGSNIFNPSALGVGNHIIAYTYKDLHGCSRTASDDIIVNPLPALQWTTPLQSQFTSSTTYPLTGGLPPGGTYSGPGVSGNNFNASFAGPGLHTLTYSFTDANSCSSSVSNTILTLLPPDTLSDLSGVLSYANTASTKLENASIQLTKNGTLIAETLTNANGEYLFTDLQPGTYMLKAIVNQPSGGGNAVDALLIMKHFVGMTTLASPWLEACDVDASYFVNATDGLEVMKHFVGIVNSYPSGDWYSETAVITLSGGFSGVQNLKAVCFGDVDGSFQP